MEKFTKDKANVDGFVKHLRLEFIQLGGFTNFKRGIILFVVKLVAKQLLDNDFKAVGNMTESDILAIINPSSLEM